MRKSGILFHIASLPNEYGIGTMGKEAYEFVDYLEECGQSFSYSDRTIMHEGALTRVQTAGRQSLCTTFRTLSGRG